MESIIASVCECVQARAAAVGYVFLVGGGAAELALNCFQAEVFIYTDVGFETPSPALDAVSNQQSPLFGALFRQKNSLKN